MRLLRFAAMVTCDKGQLATWTCEGCKNLPGVTVLTSIFDDIQDNFAYVALDANSPYGPSIIVSVRGTTGWKNWVEDVEAWHDKVNFKNLTNVRVHAGWMKGFTNMRDQVQAGVAKGLNMSPNARIMTTGHSMGGAFAELLAVDLATTEHIGQTLSQSLDTPITVYHNITVYNYGTPRVGDANWASLAHQCIFSYYRLTHAQDIVPRMPPTIIPFSYRHPPTEVWLPDAAGKQIKICSATNGEDPNCINGSGPYSFSDHVQYLGHDIGHCACPPVDN